jgi:hypothetical protein
VIDLTAVQKKAVRNVLASVFAGYSTERLRAEIGGLPTRGERQAVFCTACRIRKEVAATCLERGDEIGSFLAAHCGLFEPNRRPCMLHEIYGVSLGDLGRSPRKKKDLRNLHTRAAGKQNSEEPVSSRGGGF